MPSKAMGDPKTIIAVCTPRGHGGVGLVRLSGPGAVAIGSSLFQSERDLSKHAKQVVFGRIVDGHGTAVDTALCWYLPAPATYTGEDVVEISTHGSDAVLDLVVEWGIRGGAQLAEPGEFTRRAFINGRMDLLQAEAVADVIRAQSRGSLETAYGVLGGDLSSRVRSLRDALVDALARIESQLDFGDDVSADEVGDADAILQRVGEGAETLLASFGGARARLRGFRVVLIGRPNVGKSTLFNALLGEDRSIVTDVPGTTRDWVEAITTWDGESVRLIDTAGLRPTTDAVEREGVARTEKQMAAADLILHISDRAEAEMAATSGAPTLCVRSKADLAPPATHNSGSLAVSARTGEGLAELQRVAMSHLGRQAELTGAPTRERHKDALQAVSEAVQRSRVRLTQDHAPELAATDLHRALSHIGGLLGENVDEAILDRIFSEFCIGK